jgi:hypothetical protein
MFEKVFGPEKVEVCERRRKTSQSAVSRAACEGVGYVA